jgi:membrane-bound metal-dependent hydrolase YbcI (DUF457 family)
MFVLEHLGLILLGGIIVLVSAEIVGIRRHDLFVLFLLSATATQAIDFDHYSGDLPLLLHCATVTSYDYDWQNNCVLQLHRGILHASTVAFVGIPLLMFLAIEMARNKSYNQAAVMFGFVCGWIIHLTADHLIL